MNIGARILKTGLAVTFALLVSGWLELSNVTLVAIAAFLAVQPSVTGSWRHLWEQVQANALGALFAVGAVYFLGNHPLVIGLIVIVLLALTTKLGFSSGPVSILCAISIMEVQEANFMLFATERFLSILLGILCALFINMIFLAPKYEKKFLMHIHKTTDYLTVILRSMVQGELEAKAYQQIKEESERQIKSADDLYNLYYKELKNKWKKTAYSETKSLVVFTKLLDLVKKEQTIIHLFDHNSHHLLSPDLDVDLKKILQHQLFLTTSYHEKILLKHEGKIKVSYPDELNEEIRLLNEELIEHLHRLIVIHKEQPSTEKDDPFFFLISFITHLTQLSSHLESIDQLIEHTQRRQKKNPNH